MLSLLSPCSRSLQSVLKRFHASTPSSPSLSLFLSYSFLCTWPWLFPHCCVFPSPPLWQLHINHSHIPRKTASPAFLHSLPFILPISLSLSLFSFTPLLSFPPHTWFLTSHEISICAHATKMVSPFSRSCHAISCGLFCQKVLHSLRCHPNGSESDLF